MDERTKNMLEQIDLKRPVVRSFSMKYHVSFEFPSGEEMLEQLTPLDETQQAFDALVQRFYADVEELMNGLAAKLPGGFELDESRSARGVHQGLRDPLKEGGKS